MSQQSRRRPSDGRIVPAKSDDAAGQDGKASPPQGQPHNRWTTAAICIFLAVIVWAVFGQTVRYGFVNYDDSLYVYENPTVTAGLTLKGIASSFTYAHSDNWHSVDDPVAHGGLADLRTKRRRTSSDECPAPRRKRHPPVPRSAGHDRGRLAQRVCGGGVRCSSVARGIGGVGGGAQGRVKRVVFHAHDLGVCALRATGRRPEAKVQDLVWTGAGIFHLWPDEQADAGDGAVCPAAAGLLAIEAIGNTRFTIHDWFVGFRKSSLPAAGGG